MSVQIYFWQSRKINLQHREKIWKKTLFAKYLHTMIFSFPINTTTLDQQIWENPRIVNRGRYSLLNRRVKSKKCTRIFNKDFDIFP